MVSDKLEIWLFRVDEGLASLPVDIQIVEENTRRFILTELHTYKLPGPITNCNSKKLKFCSISSANCICSSAKARTDRASRWWCYVFTKDWRRFIVKFDVRS